VRLRKIFLQKDRGLPKEGVEPPPLSRIGYLTFVLLLEPALEVALVGLNFFLSQRIVITAYQFRAMICCAK
jgi:hypothetical protein